VDVQQVRAKSTDLAIQGEYESGADRGIQQAPVTGDPGHLDVADAASAGVPRARFGMREQRRFDTVFA